MLPLMLPHRTTHQAGALADVLFSSPRPKNSAITLKPSALFLSCVKNLSCARAALPLSSTDAVESHSSLKGQAPIK